MKKQVTIKDLSKSLGFSISTISKALNDSNEISEGTKEKVKRLAKEYNYYPNFYAKNLKMTRKNNTINFLDTESQSRTSLIAEVVNNPELNNCKYSMCKINTNENMVEQLVQLESKKIKGFILVYDDV